MGYIKIYTGPVRSGKTKSLLEEINLYSKENEGTKNKLLAFNHSFDVYAREQKIQSFDGDSCSCFNVSSAANIKSYLNSYKDFNISEIFINELQFFEPEIISLLKYIQTDTDILCVCSGLDTNFYGMPFGIMADILAMCNEVIKLSSECTICGDSAYRSQRLIESNSLEVCPDIEGFQTHEPRCFKHFQPRNRIKTVAYPASDWSGRWDIAKI
jgi:thymidine kinase